MSDFPDYHQFKSAMDAQTPAFVKKLCRVLAYIFFILPALMLFLPWQQNVTAFGAVTAFSPNDRRQAVNAPVSGVIVEWYVQEGAKVKMGDPLLLIRDIDPQFKNRLTEQLEARESKLQSKQEELMAYQVQLRSLLTVRDSRVLAARFKLDAAKQAVVTAAEGVRSAEATLGAADLQITRLERLLQEGLVAKREVEVATRDREVAQRAFNSAKADLDSAKAQEKSALAEVQQIRADAQASIDATNGLVKKIGAELADSRNDLQVAQTNLSRQQSQLVTAPRDGTVLRVMANSPTEVVSQGDRLMFIVPDTVRRSVELKVDGLHAALITPGANVRLEFEGWPAAQISGWPSVAIGTFGGKVAFVDPLDDGTGSFRVMVLPDETEQRWPSERFLRQGGSAKGWILMEEVRLGYEIWRILNGFPPRIPNPDAIFFGDSPSTTKAGP